MEAVLIMFFEKMGVAYALRLLPNSEESQVARASEKPKCRRNWLQKG
jgi:hypothetical protein